ncbi:MAG: hypothetical protein J6W81_06540 [Lentisphaeria bacterium]|nr:hypothetical protein [Lentisphaeria bacterium]
MKKTVKNHFTFTDLMAFLITIPIVGIILIAHAGAVQDTQAKALYCRNNLKKIGEAAFAYADANHEMSVPAFGGNKKIKGWAQLLSGTNDAKTGYKDYYGCPDDEVKRIVLGGKISYNLNTGHLWGYPYRKSSKQEWGPANRGSYSPLHGTSVSFNVVEEPANTLWFFERHMPGSTWDNFWKKGDATHWATWRLHFWTHKEAGKKGVNNMLFMDGRVEAVAEGTWKQGDIRSVVFKSLHQTCMGNMNGKD